MLWNLHDSDDRYSLVSYKGEVALCSILVLPSEFDETHYTQPLSVPVFSVGLTHFNFVDETSRVGLRCPLFAFFFWAEFSGIRCWTFILLLLFYHEKQREKFWLQKPKAFNLYNYIPFLFFALYRKKGSNFKFSPYVNCGQISIFDPYATLEFNIWALYFNFFA